MVEIGCIEMVNRIPTGETFHCWFNPEREMPAAAEAVHGLSDSFLADKPLFAAKAEDLLAFLGTSLAETRHAVARLVEQIRGTGFSD